LIGAAEAKHATARPTMASAKREVLMRQKSTPARHGLPGNVDQRLHTASPMQMRTFLSLLFGIALVAALTLANVPDAVAQTTPTPPPGWAGSASAGLALTSGNSDTSTVNAAYDLKRDTGGPYLFKSAGLFLYGKSEDVLTSDRLSFDGRLERKLTERASLFGQTQYLRDAFKSIDYLIAPTVGLNYLLVKNERSELGVDGGVGGVWEKNPGLDTDLDGALTAGQRFSHKLTATTELVEKVAALWKMDDFGDALYTFSIGLAASITDGTQMKIEFLDTYKARPPVDIEKNDIATLVSFVYKFD
jgi:putative salt-induced outer membrane protein YdiY